MTGNVTDLACDFCEPWFDPKPLVETCRFSARGCSADGMSRSYWQ